MFGEIRVKGNEINVGDLNYMLLSYERVAIDYDDDYIKVGTVIARLKENGFFFLHEFIEFFGDDDEAPSVVEEKIDILGSSIRVRNSEEGYLWNMEDITSVFINILLSSELKFMTSEELLHALKGDDLCEPNDQPISMDTIKYVLREKAHHLCNILGE